MDCFVVRYLANVIVKSDTRITENSTTKGPEIVHKIFRP